MLKDTSSFSPMMMFKVISMQMLYRNLCTKLDVSNHKIQAILHPNVSVELDGIPFSFSSISILMKHIFCIAYNFDLTDLSILSK